MSSLLYKKLDLFSKFHFNKYKSHLLFRLLIQILSITSNAIIISRLGLWKKKYKCYYFFVYTTDNIFKIKKLLGILAESVPFTANISSIADKLTIGRNTIKEYLHALEKAGLLNFLNRKGKGVSLLQKPDKMYLGNTNLFFLIL